MSGFMKRVAAYCRVSTDLEEQKTSLNTQIDAFQKLISARPGWELVDIYADEGLTGTSARKRKAFQRMMAGCEAGRIDYIVTKSISRFARNTVDTLTYVRKLKELGVYVLFEKEKLDTASVASELALTILAACAQEESRSISENVKWGCRKRYIEGQCKWANVFGYAREGEKEFVIVEKEAAVVRRVFRMYAEGLSLLEICARLNGEENSLRKTWYPKSVSAMLHNEKYVGDIALQKSYTADYLTKKRIPNDGSVVERFYHRDHHAAIVDRHTFETVQKIMAMRDTHLGCTQYPYFGLLRCPVCGQLMYRFRLRGHDARPAWTCGGGGCPPYAVRESCVDQAIREGLKQIAPGKLKERARGGGPAAQAARAAARWQRLPLKTIEYLLLDELVESIAFLRWDRVRIVWKFGMTGEVDIIYKKPSEWPLAEIETVDGRTLINGENWGEQTPMLVYSIERARKMSAGLQVIAPEHEPEGCFSRPKVYVERADGKESGL